MQTGKRQAQVIRVNDEPSEKLKMFSTVIGLNRVIDGPYGKNIASEGIGVILTEKKPHDLKLGDLIEVDVVQVQTSEYNGQANTIGRCLFLGKVGAKKTPAAKPKAGAEA